MGCEINNIRQESSLWEGYVKESKQECEYEFNIRLFALKQNVYSIGSIEYKAMGCQVPPNLSDVNRSKNSGVYC